MSADVRYVHRLALVFPADADVGRGKPAYTYRMCGGKEHLLGVFRKKGTDPLGFRCCPSRRIAPELVGLPAETVLDTNRQCGGGGRGTSAASRERQRKDRGQDWAEK